MIMGDWHPMPPGAAHYVGTPSTRFGTFYWNAGRVAADYRFKKETKAYSAKLAREQRKKNRKKKAAFVRKVVGRVNVGLMKVLKKVGRVKKRRAARKEGTASTKLGDGTGWSRLGKAVLDGLMVPAAIVGCMVFPSVDIRRGGSASVEKDGAGDTTTPGAAAAKNPDTKKEETDKPATTVATPECPENTTLSTITTLKTGTTVAAGTATASTPTTNKTSYMSPTPTILNSPPPLPQIITTPPSTSTIDSDEGEEDPDAIAPVRVHRLDQQIPTGLIDLGELLEDPDSGNTTTTPTNRSSSGANTTVTNPPMYPPGSTIVPVTITPAGAAQMAQEQQEREQGQQGQQGVKRQRSKLQKKRSVKDKGRKAKVEENEKEKDVAGVTADAGKTNDNGEEDGDEKEKEKAGKDEKCLPVKEWLKREKVRGNAIQALKPKKSLRKEIMKVFKQDDA